MNHNTNDTVTKIDVRQTLTQVGMDWGIHFHINIFKSFYKLSHFQIIILFGLFCNFISFKTIFPLFFSFFL